MAGIRAVRAGEAGFIGQEHSSLNGVFDSLNQPFQPIVVVGQADCVEMPDSRSLGLGDDIESERRPLSGELLESVAEHGRLQVTVCLAVRPHARSRLEIDQAIADTAVLVGRAIGGVKLAIAKFRALDPAYPGNGLSGATSVFHDVINQYLDSSRGCLDDAAVERDFANIWLGRSDSGLLL